MRIKILSSALEDLYEARLFYEQKGVGLGDYFFDSLFSDIDSLVLYGGIHQKVAGYHRLGSSLIIFYPTQMRPARRYCGLSVETGSFISVKSLTFKKIPICHLLHHGKSGPYLSCESSGSPSRSEENQKSIEIKGTV